MIELILVLFIVSIFTLGKLVSASKRQKILKKYNRSTTTKSHYSLVHNLEPMEFGYILKGNLEYAAFLGHIISMSTKKGIQISYDSPGLKIDISDKHTKSISKIDSAVLLSLKGHSSLSEAFSFNYNSLTDCLQSNLSEKGWLSTTRPSLDKFLDYYFKKYFIKLVYAFVLINVAVTLLFLLLKVDLDMLYALVSMVNITFLSVTYFYTIIEYTKQINNHKHNLTIFASEDYSKKFNDIHGLYLYLKVSGEDTMTPDFEETLFDQLDSLYPYYVACGLDNKIKEMNISLVE